MQAALTIIRYKKRFIPFAFLAMALHRIPLMLNSQMKFYKLMGCGKNGTFDKVPDLQQWAILTAGKNDFEYDNQKLQQQAVLQMLYGHFISQWFSFFSCETYTLFLEAVEGHGTWDGKEVFGPLPAKSSYEGPIATLTRATIRINKLKYFWRHVAPVASQMATAPGFLTSYGIGEVPWIKQATFSVWESKAAMKNFAYGMKQHAEVIVKTRKEKWYSEDMFVRFKVLHSSGTLLNKNVLEGKT